MNADRRLLAMCFVISATAYLFGCITCAAVWQVPFAALLALFALAANSLSYMLQFSGQRTEAIVTSAISWLAGVSAGALLLVKL